MTTLLDLSAEMSALSDLALASADEDGSLSPETEKAIDDLLADLQPRMNTKVAGYVKLIQQSEGIARVIKEERDRLAVCQRVQENLAVRLKLRLLAVMQAKGWDRMGETPYGVAIRKNGGKVPVKITAEINDLMPDYQRMRIEPDLDAIRTDLESGVPVFGCHLGERGVHLAIY
jgi:hypothetical protein